MPLTNRASTSANPDPVISSAFVEANYEVLKSLLRCHRRQVCNEDLRTKLNYYSEEYDEDREMEPRSNLKMPRTGIGAGLKGNLMAGGLWSEEYKMVEVVEETFLCYSQPTWEVLHNSIVSWIEDYPLPYRLKMPSHVGSYDGKGDPNNYLHLFEGAIRMQKWAMPVACHMFTYTLKDSAGIWWNGQKSSSIVNYEDLKAKFRSHFSQQKKFTKIHLGVHNVKQRDGETKKVATNGAPNDHKEGYDRFNKNFSWDNSKGKKKNRDRSLRVDSKIPLVGFSREHSWPLGEVPLEVTVGESPHTRKETLNFVIGISNSPYKLLLGRTTMQKMGIVVSTIHAAIKLWKERACIYFRASNWLESLLAGSISRWEDLTTRFIGQFFPPGKTAKLRNDMFQQHQEESLSEA
ncbi:reverse transcriptase domain-containing protein [Tanacetum coccineum]